MGVIERFYEIMKPIIEEEKKKPQKNNENNLMGTYAKAQFPIVFDELRTLRNGRTYPRDHTSQDCQMSAVIGLITFAAEQIIETEKEDKEQITRELERIVADGTDDNEDNDQSEHTIEPKLVTNGNDGLRKNDSGTQLQATINGEANPEINITKTSANTKLRNVNGSDGLGGNGCGTQLQAATNDKGHENHKAIDNTDNEDNNEQVNDNRIGGQQQQNGQKSNDETQHQQDGLNNKPEEIGSPHTTHHEQEIGNPNTSQPKIQPPLITQPPELSQVKGKGVPKLEPTLTLLTISHPSKSSEKRQMQPQLLQTCPQNTPKVTRPVQDPRNRNKDSIQTTKQKQNLIPRLTSRISWIEEERVEERREGGDLENRETDKENREILDGNGGDKQ
ncbi:MAG: hypothetical protein EZS28_041037 [Streblomastix strix]|uniref:Uncharacterized protein n=1 Tax=Streblomastix strix TaxID=222440 RepID=A0A5J4U161_9EUKA|nr:MAG: hypothetical protein EZS28_041037 [Streblomastix strix]